MGRGVNHLGHPTDNLRLPPTSNPGALGVIFMMSFCPSTLGLARDFWAPVQSTVPIFYLSLTFAFFCL